MNHVYTVTDSSENLIGIFTSLKRAYSAALAFSTGHWLGLEREKLVGRTIEYNARKAEFFLTFDWVKDAMKRCAKEFVCSAPFVLLCRSGESPAETPDFSGVFIYMQPVNGSTDYPVTIGSDWSDHVDADDRKAEERRPVTQG